MHALLTNIPLQAFLKGLQFSPKTKSLRSRFVIVLVVELSCRHPPHECRYALGYYRPGSCAPYLIPPVPLSLRGALLEAGAVVGGVFLIP